MITNIYPIIDTNYAMSKPYIVFSVVAYNMINNESDVSKKPI